MGSGPRPGRQRIVFGHQETAELRAALFAQFGTQPRYGNIVRQDLRPLWEVWIRTPEGTGDNRVFDHFARLPDLPAPLRAYVAGVRSVVADTLRLTENGRPSRWACAYLHADVEPRQGRGPVPPHLPTAPVDEFPFGAFWRVRGCLSIDVSPSGATMEMVDATGDTFDVERISGDSGYSGDD